MPEKAMSYETEFSDTVYHVTLESRLACLEEGLFPNPDRGVTPEWRLLERRLEAGRPAELQAKDVSRLGSVFAWPTLEHAEKDVQITTGSEASNDNERLAIIAINADPTVSYVCEAFCCGNGCSPEEYWETAVTLNAFRGSPHKFTVPGRIPRTFIYQEPEVLLSGFIDPSRLALVGCSRHRVRDQERRANRLASSRPLKI